MKCDSLKHEITKAKVKKNTRSESYFFRGHTIEPAKLFSRREYNYHKQVWRWFSKRRTTALHENNTYERSTHRSRHNNESSF